MNLLTQMSEVKAHLEAHPISLLFIKMANCGVCDATLDKTIKLLEAYPEVEGRIVSIEQMPEISGEYLVFAAPTILLFFEGKEVHRQSRIVVFGELEDALETVRRFG